MDLMLYSGRPEPSLLHTAQQLEPVCWAAICLLKTGSNRSLAQGSHLYPLPPDLLPQEKTLLANAKHSEEMEDRMGVRALQRVYQRGGFSV